MNPGAPALRHADWSRNANIYEVNVRQYTPEGTFDAFAKQLPRLQRLGVDILWLMPIHPIGKQNRKGTLGSGYSVRDHRAVNPELGTMADFRRLVRQAHGLGMRVIIDWVANHTAWDHPWVSEHPDWYLKDAQGAIHSYVYDNGRELEHWTDVVGLDWRQPALWTAMTDALRFWMREADIDGYRCDVAGLIPTPFWEQARTALDAIKPVFLLAEWSDPALHERAFDMTYDWDLYDVMKTIAGGEGDARDLAAYVERSRAFPKDAYRMLFTSNHDKNAWEASDTERYGASFKAFAVLAATLPGMPLVYGGQEAVLDKRLDFFEKDTIDWKTCELAAFYGELLRLKKQTPALWNGSEGGDVEVLPLSSRAVFAFRRRRPGSAVTVAVNLSAEPQPIDPGSGVADTELAPWSCSIRTEE